jgi:uncharacterized protein YjbI with pentapeptide repeats
VKTQIMFNDDINKITRNWIIAVLVFLISIPFLVAIYPIYMILTLDKVEVLKEKSNYIIEILKTAGLFSGGIAASINIVFAAKRAAAMEDSAKAANESAKAANKNAEVAQDKQITERFAKAIEQLASDKIEVRLGAIYTLERIAKDSEKDQWTIMEVLTAFVRENAPIKKEEKPQSKKPLVDEWLNVQKEKEIEELPKLRLDIQECLTVIGRRKHPDPKNTRLDLRNVNISKANLRGAKLENVNFMNAKIESVNFTEAKLKSADFMGAKLAAANLKNANLTQALLLGADLFGAILESANLKEANLQEAKLEGVNLRYANLEGANLKMARLIRADMVEANLKEADLAGSKIIGVHLTKADLTRANFTRACLTQVNLSEANLTRACLREVNLSEAILEGANLKGAIMPDGSIHD